MEAGGMTVLCIIQRAEEAKMNIRKQEGADLWT
jgi:hypothetical protein